MSSLGREIYCRNICKLSLCLLLKELIEILMPPLIEKWNVLADDNKDLFPLLEVPILYYTCAWSA